MISVQQALNGPTEAKLLAPVRTGARPINRRRYVEIRIFQHDMIEQLSAQLIWQVQT